MNDGHGDRLNLEDLLHPAHAFGHPSEVVNDPDLTLNEKRAILAAWASDACAIEAAPELRLVTPQARPVSFDDIMDALRSLDRQTRATFQGHHWQRRPLNRWRTRSRGGGPNPQGNDRGPPLN